MVFLDCNECRKWVTTEPGKPYVDSQGNKVPRPESNPPACHICKKGEVTELSAANWKTLTLYFRHKHLGLDPHERADELIREHVVMLGEIEAEARQQQAVSLSAAMQGNFLAGMMGRLKR